jgi:DNA-binding NarL/FixJ family response regulator
VISRDHCLVPPVQVLIVDDQQPFRRAAAAVVAATDGFVVSGEVDSGERCLAAVADGTAADLVLMDVNMPGMDGLECTRRLLATRDDVVVVLLSTYDEEELGELARECGAAPTSRSPRSSPTAWSRRGPPPRRPSDADPLKCSPAT